ncbi:telomerase reverse transcriptase [Diospyros lotus]|uniref:telomerase reverse transcriptase n=1 Tax=Diospyros lotus TaxID=55363 RepID=UPI00224EE919|nr:telomerase reverse transcriptase [Diospyros lotus]
MAKKRRVPEVLWRLFRNRARDLAHTIISLLPPPPPSPAECLCKGRQCLGCSGDRAMSFLLRQDDPADYRKLVTQCFIVVSDNAPPLEFSPERRWSQRQIVEGTIQLIISEQASSINALCSNYRCPSSPGVELLTSSAWCLLLRRVGDGIMIYLLKHASIFLPLPRNKHYQVAGFPISEFCFKPKHISKPKYQHSALVLESGKKRKRVDEVGSMPEKEHPRGDFSEKVRSSLVSCSGCDGTSHSTSCTRIWGKKNCMGIFSGQVKESTGNENTNNDQNSNGKHLECSNQIMAKPRKRHRQFSWQRNWKHRQLDSQEQYSLPQFTGKGDRSSGRPLSGIKTSMPLQCTCCLVLQNLQYVAREAHIDRQSMFYKLECSSLVFPRKHILNSLKPNISGAYVLFKDIFGLSDNTIGALSKPCFHSSNCCLINRTCLFHSLLKLLKNLIRKAQHCQHLKLLEKHCSIPSDQNYEARTCSIYKANEFQPLPLEKQCTGFQRVGNLPCTKFSHFDTSVSVCASEMKHHSVPSKAYCLKKQVVSFLWAVCRSIVPPELLGASSNWRILRRNISRFILLRRFEKFSLKQCIHKLKTSMFLLLSNKHSSCYSSDDVLKCRKEQNADMPRRYSQVNNVTDTVKHKIVEKWIFWFFSFLVVPLVQANFYVTESEHGKQDIFYYQKSIWEKVTNGAITYLKDQSYRPLSDVLATNIICRRTFGFSRIRLRPKENGVRILANLKVPSRIPVKGCSLKGQSYESLQKVSLFPKHVKYTYFKSVNSVLHNLHAVLKGLQVTEPEKLGSSVFDYSDIYRKLCPFLSVLKNVSTSMPAVFIVVSDVSKAYDSVNQDKLLSVMKDVIHDDEYLIKKSHQVVCAKKSLWVRQNLIQADLGSSSGSTKLLAPSPSNCTLHGVIVNQVWSNARKKDLFFILNEHVKHNVLQWNKQYYLQDVGISQGSVLSSLLCSFYYGHLERNVILPFLQKTPETATGDFSGSAGVNNSDLDVTLSSPKYILLRFIDDFLFISTSKKQAASFFSRLKRGFREYNCYMNEEKFGVNFDIDQVLRHTSNRMYTGEDGIPFLRWSGLFINCCTLEVQADYTRYLNMHLSSTLTVCWQGKPARHLKEKLCHFLRPKCHPIFYDSNINSAAAVRLNVYQAFLLSAMKFHCYVYDLSSTCRLTANSHLGIIERSLRYLYKLMKKRMHFMDLNSNIHPIFEVERREVEWLGLKAYVRVLKRKQSRHRELLRLLRTKLAASEKRSTVSSVLKYAVDDSHSSVMWKIKY